MKRKLFWTAGIIVITVLILIAVALLVKYLVGPEMVGEKVRGEFKKVWAGPVKVEGVTFNYTKPILINQVVLADEQGREWMAFQGVTLELVNLLKGKTAVQGIMVDRAEIDAYVDQRRIDAPLVKLEREEKDGMEDFRYLLIEKGLVRVHSDEQEGVAYDNLRLSAKRHGDQFAVDFQQGTTASGDYAIVNGMVGMGGENPDIDLRWEGQHAVTPVESELLLGLMEVGWIRSLNGSARWGFDMIGRLGEPKKMLIDGQGEVRNVRVVGQDAVLVENGGCVIEGTNDRFEIVGANDRFEIVGATGDFCCGTFRYDGYVVPGGEHFAGHGGTLELRELNLPALGRELPNVREFAHGTGHFRLNYSMQGAAVETLSGDGSLMLDDADMGSLPLISAMFKVLGVGVIDPVASADVAVHFTMDGPVAMIDKGEVGSSLAALKVQEGSTVNMQTKYIDGYVVGSVLSDLEEFLGKIPVVELFVEAKAKLTRLRVEGEWTEEPMELISKQPLEDVGEATIGFFKGVLETGGDLGKGVLDVLGF